MKVKYLPYLIGYGAGGRRRGESNALSSQPIPSDAVLKGVFVSGSTETNMLFHWPLLANVNNYDV